MILKFGINIYLITIIIIKFTALAIHDNFVFIF